MDVNQVTVPVSMVFSRALTEKVSSSLNEVRRLTRIISNDDGVFNLYLFHEDEELHC